MSKPTTNYRESYFQHPSLTQISGDPTYKDLAKHHPSKQHCYQIRMPHGTTNIIESETGSLQGTVPEILQSLFDTYGDITPSLSPLHVRPY
jgi:hypothetical protein